MSEEEIIKDLEKYIELINKEYCDECNELNAISGKYCNGSRNVALAIQGLLDLYNQEKEKNKKWEDKIKAKIEELKNREENVVQYTDNKVILYAIQKVLQELLEEKE